MTDTSELSTIAREGAAPPNGPRRPRRV